jgi:2-C-methyl-D-erythritol 4-phosphate cytidylyltransferase
MTQQAKNKGRRGVTAIVPAAGLGKRFGEEKNKSFYFLLNKPLIVWTLEALQNVEEITEIIPVLKEDDLISGSELVEQYNITKVKRIVPGGRERQNSVYNAIKILDDKTSVVVIHDGARPLVDKEIVKRTMEGLKGAEAAFDGIVAGVPVKDTIKEVSKQWSVNSGEEEIIIKKTLNRNILWAVQTPQVFPLQKIRGAYEQAISDKYHATDDAALVEKYGGRIKIVMGSYRNIKITTLEDIHIAEAFLNT